MFDLGKALEAGGVDLGDALLAVLLGFDLAIAQCAFQRDELAFLQRAGELGEIAPGKDAVPFGAGFVLALVVLPVFLGGDIEDGVVAVVLSGAGFCVLSEAADESDFVEHDVGSVSSGLSAICGTCLPNGCVAPSTPSATEEKLWKGTPARLGQGVHTSQRRVAASRRESVRPKGVDAFGAAR